MIGIQGMRCLVPCWVRSSAHMSSVFYSFSAFVCLCVFFKPYNKNICNWVIFLCTTWHPVHNSVLDGSIYAILERKQCSQVEIFSFSSILSLLYTQIHRDWTKNIVFFPFANTWLRIFFSLVSILPTKLRLLIDYSNYIRYKKYWTELKFHLSHRFRHGSVMWFYWELCKTSSAFG